MSDDIFEEIAEEATTDELVDAVEIIDAELQTREDF
jgi:hypothetical protein